MLITEDDEKRLDMKGKRSSVSVSVSLHALKAAEVAAATAISTECKRNKTTKQIKEIVYNWTQTSSAHGIGNIARSKNSFLLVVWIVFVMLSTAYCGYQIIEQILKYYQYNVVTSTESINEVPTNFPAIDICNLNPFDGNYARAFIENLTAEVRPKTQSKSAIYNTVLLTNFIQSAMEARSASDVYWAGFWLEQMLISCRFRGIACNINTDFYYHYDFYFGNCFRFNAGQSRISPYNETLHQKIKMVKKAGSDNGLQLELFAGDAERQQQYAYKTGFRVVVHNQSVVPFPKEDGIDVSTGQQTNIMITRTFINKLSTPHSDCINAHLYAHTTDETVRSMRDDYAQPIYNQKYCLKVCLQKFIFELCACQYMRYPYVVDKRTNTALNASKPTCQKPSDIECAGQAELSFYETDRATECYKSCPLECSSVRYDTKVSVASYPTEWYMSQLINSSDFIHMLDMNDINGTSNATLPYLQQTILMINVFYDEMTFLQMSETPATSLELVIAFIGGNLGLFIGVSLLSFVEIVEVIYLTLRVVYQNWYVKRNTTAPVLISAPVAVVSIVE